MLIIRELFVNKRMFLMDCIFCKIVAGNLPAQVVYQDEKILAFSDIRPLAPIHVLVIPKVHISSADEVREEHAALLGHIFAKMPHIASLCGAENGYRIVTNIGEDGMQEVGHLHFHLLAGRRLGGICSNV